MIMLNKYDGFVGLCDCCTSPHKEPKKKYLYNIQVNNKMFYVCRDCLRELQQQLNTESEFIKTGKIEKQYKCTKDCQGCNWFVDRVQTVEEWRELAKEWANMDDLEEVEKTLEKLPQNKVMEFIADIWQLEFKEVNENEI